MVLVSLLTLLAKGKEKTEVAFETDIMEAEEIQEQLKNIALKEDIRLAQISALGAVGDFTVGVFYTAEKQYHANRFTGDWEIVSLTGSITRMRGEYYAHLHMSAGGGIKLAMNRNFIVSAEAAAPFDKKDGEMAVYIALNYIF